jgi:D-glycero-D-manno-heptose 1,7-bisphosphate phosphatase
LRKPAIFLDRDGILNGLVHDETRDVMGSPLAVDELALFRHAPSFVQAMNARGFLVLVTTNQPALAHGRLSPIGLDRIHRKLCDDIAAGGGRIDGIFFCPHDSDAHVVPGARVRKEYAIPCRCRKPAPGMILRAAQTHKVDLPRSFMVCRDLEDVKAGRSAALETILLSDVRLRQIEASPDLRPHHVVPELPDVVRIIDATHQTSESR